MNAAFASNGSIKHVLKNEIYHKYEMCSISCLNQRFVSEKH